VPAFGLGIIMHRNPQALMKRLLGMIMTDIIEIKTVVSRRKKLPGRSGSISDHFQKMSHLFLLSFEVIYIRLIGSDFNGNAVDDLEAVSRQTNIFTGIVRNKAKLPCSQGHQNLSSDAVIAVVGFETELAVGFHGVDPMFLDGVGSDLVRKSDASSFLVRHWE